jgi:O-antigen/teichoic acid export membrane protein
LITAGSEPARDVAGAVAVSAIAQLLGKGVHLALNIVASIALIRYMQPDGYGAYVFVFSFAALFGLLSDFGLAKVAVRDMSREPRSAGVVLGTAVAGRLLLAAISFVGAQIALVLLGVPTDLRIAVAIVSLLFVTEAVLSVTAVFQVRLAMQYEALVMIVIQAVDTALILALIAAGAGLHWIVAAPVASGVVGVVFAYTIARRRFHARLTVDFSRLPRLLVEAAPVGLTLVLAVMYLRIDSVLLGLLATPQDVGLYGAAFKPVEYLLLASAVVINTLFPLLARWYRRDAERFAALYWRGTDVLLALALPIPILLLAFAEPIVATFYAPSFLPAALPLRLLGIAVVLMILSAWQGFALLSAGRQRVTVAYDIVGLVLNLVLNFALIPSYGFVGAAIAALITAVFVNVASSVLAWRLLDVRHGGSRLLQLVSANVLFAVMILMTSATGVVWWTTLLVSSAAYPFFLIICGVTNLRELRVLADGRRSIATGVPVLETT